MRNHHRLIALLSLILVGALALPALGQEDSITEVKLHTPYLGVSVEPGETADFDLEVTAPEGEVVALSVEGVPEGWTAIIRGGGFVVDRVLVSSEVNQRLRLEVDVPADAANGTYRFSVVAEGESGSDRLDFSLTVSETVGGGVFLTSEFPVLRGPSDTSFSFSLELENDTPEEIQFGLEGQGPIGWIVEVKPSGQQRASTLTVSGGETRRISVSVDPPDFAPAGTYPILVTVSGGGRSVSIELGVEITGSFDIALLTPDERLNLEVEAGSSTEMVLTVVNQGTAPLEEVKLSAVPPRGWEVTFSPEEIDVIAPGESAQVTATVTPAENAIAGDYRMRVTARTAEVSDRIEIRTTVQTSAVWGLVGVGIIVVALGALTMVFRQFGRR
jgi:uncharacterized membrane protein